MAAVLSELLSPQVILRVVSRIKRNRGPLGAWLGFHADRFDKNTVSLSGPNTLRAEGTVRNYTYRIFDYTRVPMKARAPGTGPGMVAQNPMGQNTVSIARYHEKIALDYEFLGNLSRMIGPNSQIDARGQAYIAQQTSFLAAQGNNMVEMMSAGMLRDSLYFKQVGDNWLPTFTAPATGAYLQVNFQIPAGNKSQLNMLGTGSIIDVSWANQAAPIVKHLQSIIAAYAQLSGYTLTDIWLNSLLWYYVITNTEVRNLAGSAASPFAEFDRVQSRGMNDSGPPDYYGVIKGQPTVKWHMADGTLALDTDIDPSYSTAPAAANLAKLVPDNMAIFSAEPSAEWCQLIEGSEMVVENPGQPAQMRTGWHFWHEYKTQPSAVELIALMNCVPALYVPKVVAPAQVIFP